VGAPPNRLATKHCEPRRDVRRKTDPGLELRGRENLQLTQVTSKGARATAPPSLTNSVQAFCYPQHAYGGRLQLQGRLKGRQRWLWPTSRPLAVDGLCQP
jgi:hypothetical protein